MVGVARAMSLRYHETVQSLAIASNLDLTCVRDRPGFGPDMRRTHEAHYLDSVCPGLVRFLPGCGM